MVYNNYIKKNNKRSERINSLLSVGFVLSVIVYVTIALILTGFVSIYKVNGESSSPFIEYGDTIIDVKVPANDLEIGDIITKSSSSYDNLFDQTWNTIKNMFFGGEDYGVITHQIVRIYGVDYATVAENEATVVAEVLATYAPVVSVTYLETATGNYVHPETKVEREALRLDTDNYTFVSQEIDEENLIQSEYDNSDYRENQDMYAWVGEEIMIYDEDVDYNDCYFLVRSTGYSEAITDTNDPGNDEFGGAISYSRIRGKVVLSVSLSGIKSHGYIFPVILTVVAMVVAYSVLTRKREADFIL